ncbi:TonB-dependent receptor [Govanella unica]|uniref:TonB-dependent receptor n=1 Tax=Govanella unica TaxID=2975056 RepID=A0A9X3TVM9_9PROT|nr:TonB-dependent receptor [Govania unica]MDA5192566.1 TonB-dependent receptor [Govania unica]
MKAKLLWGSAAVAMLALEPQTQALAASARDTAGLEEIVVTARRRAESIQTVPVAVAAFSSENLEMRSITDIANLSSVAPNLYVSSGPSGGAATASFFIRGIGQIDFVPTTDPGVGVYLDGVYIARQTGNVLDLLDPERVEVLRGPQGTLFGRNTIGGAISITSKRPTGDFSGKLEATGGNYNHYELKGYVEFPLVAEKLAGSVSVARRAQDGYGKRLLTGEDMGDQDVWSGRAVLNWTANDNLTVFLTADGTRRDEHAYPHQAIAIVEGDDNFSGLRAFDAFVASPPPPYGFGLPYLTPSATCPPFPAPATKCTSPFVSHGGYDSLATGPNVSKLDVWGISGTVDWTSDLVSVKSITAYRHQKDQSGVDYDGSPLRIAEQFTKFDSTQFSQEFQVYGKIGARTDWLVGAYYARETSDILFDAAFLRPAIGPEIQLRSHLKTNNYAAFASVTVGLTEALSITGGLRYSRDKKTFTDRPDFLANPYLDGAPSSVYAAGVIDVPGVGLIPAFLSSGTTLTAHGSWDEFSPKASVEYRALESVFLYASWSRGYKSGSFNGRALTASPGPLPYDPETVTAYELGAKFDFLDNRVRLNMAAFQTDYNNIQVTVLISDGPIVNTPTVNAGKARIRGFEAELQAMPVQNLRIDGSLGYVDAKFLSLNPPSSFPHALLPFNTDASFAQTPEWTANLGVQYDFPLGSIGSLTLRGDLIYRSRIYPNVPNIEAVVEKSLTLLNARATYQSPDENWQLAVYGTNLGNKRYQSFGFVSFGIATGYLAPPRQYGATITRRF